MLTSTRGLAGPSSKALSAAPVWLIRQPAVLHLTTAVHSSDLSRRTGTVTTAVAMAGTHDTTSMEVTRTWRLPDAHCHPQDDMQHAQHINNMQSTCVAVMGVCESDWPQVLQLQQLAPSKVIPCFGVHPWYAHLHSSENLPEPGTAVASTQTSPPNSNAAASVTQQGSRTKEQRDNRSPQQPQDSSLHHLRPAGSTGAPAGNDLLSACLPFLDVPEGQDMAALQSALADSAACTPSCCGHAPASQPSTSDLQPYPSHTWAHQLESLLESHPHAVVGECGLDRAAIILGSKAQPSLAHQTALVRHHLRLAAHWGRPISMHCVRATGAMQDLLQSMPADQLPQRIMLHSFGGPPESVRQLVRLREGEVGARLWFSFSTAINASKQGGREKLVERVKAVPDDRLLLETDQNTAQNIDQGLTAMLHLVAEAKGWTLEDAAEKMVANFEAFFSGFLPSGYCRQ